MQVNIKTTNITLDEGLKAYIEVKIGKGLKRFIEKFGSSCEIWVEVGRTTRHHREGDVFRAEIDIRLPNKVIRAESVKGDLYAAIDEVRDESERQLKEYRGRLFTRFKHGARMFKELLRFGRLWK